MFIAQSLVRRLSGAAVLGLILTGVLSAAGPAHGAVIASFDPAFGPAIPNLGFKGIATLDVTDACYGLGTGFQSTGGSCQITVQSIQIDFYNATLLNSNNVLTTVTLPGTFFAPGYVFGAYYDLATGKITGLDTNDSNIFPVSVTDNTDSLASINYNGDMLLYFQSGFAPIVIKSLGISSTLPGVGGAFLMNCNSNQSCTGDTSNPGRLTFTDVPEPNSVALALLGLGVLAATRRRVSAAGSIFQRGAPSRA